MYRIIDIYSKDNEWNEYYDFIESSFNSEFILENGSKLPASENIPERVVYRTIKRNLKEV